MQFTLQSIKVVCFVCNLAIWVIGLTLVISGLKGMYFWMNRSSVFESHYSAGFKFAFALGASMMLTSIFGAVAAIINGYGMLVVYIIMLSLVIVLDLSGTVFMIIGPWGNNLKLLKRRMDYLSPDELSPLQFTFRCCGFEKFTDYFMIWKLWANTERPNKTLIDWVMTKGGEDDIDELGNSRSSGHHETTSWEWGKKTLVKHEHSQDTIALKKKTWKETVYKEKARVRKKNYDKILERARKQKYLRNLPKAKRHQVLTNLKWKILDMIIKKISTILTSKVRYVSHISKKLFGKFHASYQHLVPDIIKKFLTPLFATLFTPLIHKYKWWYGSGWDGILLKYIYPEKGPLLPYTCCKNPALMCRGNYQDTWMEGCLFKISTQWQLDINHVFASVGISIFALIINLLSYIIFIGGIRDRYYF